MTHLLTILMNLLAPLNSVQSGEDLLELGGFSQILQRFVSNFKLEALGSLPFDNLKAFLMEYVRLTTLSLQSLRASVSGTLILTILFEFTFCRRERGFGAGIGSGVVRFIVGGLGIVEQ